MAKRPVLTAAARTISGRKVKTLRRQGKVPANVFGKKTSSHAVEVNAKDFDLLFSEVGETTLLDLQITSEKSPRPVLVVGVQRHPVTGAVLHVDFHQVSLTEKVTAKIPVEITGESPAVRDLGGVLVHALSEIEVEALPTDLPENITLDIAKLAAFGDSILIKDLPVDPKVTIMVDPEETILTVQEPKAEEVEEAPTPTEAETTVQGKPEESEGETPAAETKKSE